MPIQLAALPVKLMPGTPGQAAAPVGIPDVVLTVNKSEVRVYAVFQFDPDTNKLSVSVVDDEGRLVRMIPPDSVAQMIAAMAAYGRR